jgi:thioesterase domain-containing protein
LPLTANGKVDRQALPAPDRQAHDTAAPIRLPADDLERTIGKLWGLELNYSPVGMDDDFYRNGGHSLIALRLRARIAATLQVDLPLLALVDTPTPDKLAVRIRALLEQQPAPALPQPGPASPLARLAGSTMRRIKQLAAPGRASRRVDQSVALATLAPLQPAGTRLPLFCIHPIGGTVACYAELAAALGRDQPVYGLQAPDGADGNGHSLEELAALYLAAIASVQPAGPYRLAGWSLGGMIAFEMAQQLAAAGQRAPLLVIIDSVPFQPGDAAGASGLARMFAEDLVRQGITQPGAQGVLDALAPEPAPARVFAAWQAAACLPPGMDRDTFNQRWQQYARSHAAWRSYRAQPLRSPVYLIMAATSVAHADADLMALWAPLAVGGLGIDVLPGDHYSLLRGPTLALTAARMAALLAHASQAGDAQQAAALDRAA